MLGDGLNDAGALVQSDVGISVSDDINNFSPSCDAILDGDSFKKIKQLLQFSKSGKNIIIISFVMSILYNLVGIFFAVQGHLSPVIAAILMPASSISIVLLTTIASSLFSRKNGL
jgi:Cu+-exporting ATPase